MDGEVNKAIKFIEDCCGAGKGGVGYSPNPGQKGFGDPCRTGGAIAAFAILQKQGSPLYPKMLESWKGTVANSNEGHGSLALGFLASALGAHQVSQDHWTDFADRFFEQILSATRSDGSFRCIDGKSPQTLGNADPMLGSPYLTAAYLCILMMDRDDTVFFGHRFESK